MAAVAQPAEQVTELLQNLQVDPKFKAGDVAEASPNLDGNTSDGSIEASASVGAADAASTTGAHEGAMETGMYYAANGYATPHGFYYGGYECPIADWDDYSRHMGVDGVEVQNPGVYNENGPLLYHASGYGYTAQPIYGPYTPGTPIPAIRADGQLYGAQTYPYPGHLYQQPVPAGAQFMPSASPVAGEVPTSSAGDLSHLGGDGTNGAGVNGNNVALGPRPGYPMTLLPSSGPYGRGILPINVSNPGSQDVRAGYEGFRPGAPWPDVLKNGDSQHRHGMSQPLPVSGLSGQTLRPVTTMLTHIPGGQQHRPPSTVAAAPGTLTRVYQQPNPRMFPGPTTPVRGQGLGSNGLEPRGNGRNWIAVDKGKPRGRGNGVIINGNGTLDILNEQNRGPRITRIRNQRAAPGALRFPKGQGVPNGTADTFSAVTNKDQYNQSDFSTSYDSAKFFIIKSYSEDDIHKSIKYNVWASTPNGNKKLELAYQEAKEKAGHCPIFLFFSVNASGQFCGVAEMVGPVDFNKNMDFWQQDKWSGKVPVKWHIIKDVPNSQFRHIILENNDNKPVTNSRDTQEVKFEQGLEMLNLFKNYAFKTSILDDFQFYENRQKAMQERRSRQQAHQQQQQILGYRGNEFEQRHTLEESQRKTQDGKAVKSEEPGEKSNKAKDLDSSTKSHAQTCNGVATNEKQPSRSSEKKDALLAVGAGTDNTPKVRAEIKDTANGIMDNNSKSPGKINESPSKK